MKKNSIIIGSLIVGGILVWWHQLPLDVDKKTIAILQTASHPALDAVRTRCIQELSQQLPTFSIVVHNGQGSTDQLHMMAKQIAHDQNVVVLVAIATPAAQALAHIEKTKPIIIAAVSDPETAGIVQQNVCGSLDTLDCAEQLRLMQAVVPKAKSMGILFNIGEVNAIALVQRMKPLCQQAGIRCIDLGVSQEGDLMHLLSHRIAGCDLIWSPLDNMVAGAIALISAKMLQAKTPFFVSDNLLVNHGALGAAGIDYALSGLHVAQSVIQLIQEPKKPKDIGLIAAKTNGWWLHKSVLKKLGLAMADAPHIHWVS